MEAIGPGRGLSCPTPKALLEHVFNVYEELDQFSTFSATVYDTAWLSMIYKPGERPELLFPQCFEYLLRTQDQSGLWESYGTPFDGILNSLAALLALTVYERKLPKQTNHDIELERRIEDAKSGIQSLLQYWTVTDTVHVGFEVIVIGLLRQLEAYGIQFTFPGRADLTRLYLRKMRKFSVNMIYAKRQTTILHSLEALSGDIDFDKVSHHCTEATGILGSPAATAAYLINASQWDMRAVKYLEKVVQAFGGSGEVPSAFPTSVFELSWSLSSLLPRLASSEKPNSAALAKFESFFKTNLEAQDGIIGFAPGLLPDADDTARVLMTLKYLGKTVNPVPMIQHFQTNEHFKTYQLERNASFSANCNVLLALLLTEDVDQYAAQIEKTSTFLLQKWVADEVADKWNVSRHYTTLLLSEGLIGILKLYDSKKLRSLPEDVVLKQIPLVICQILLQILTGQQDDGSWKGSLEQSSYCIQTLAQCLCLPWNAATRGTLMQSFARGQEFVATSYPLCGNDDYLWVEKVLYQSTLLKIAYCSLACHTAPREHTWTASVAASFHIHAEKSRKMAGLLSSLPIFAKSRFVSMDLVLLEASHSELYLQDFRHAILQRDDMPLSKDKYLGIITVIWTACNHVARHVLSPDIIRDMCVVSMLIYQIDELMESIVAEFSISEIEHLELLLRREAGMKQSAGSSNGMERLENVDAISRKRMRTSKDPRHHTPYVIELNGHHAALDPVVETLQKFVAHVCEHPAVLQSPPQAQTALNLKVHRFLLGHIAHIKHNRALRPSKFSPQQPNGHTREDSVPRNYYKWVHTTASDDTSCPFALQYFACLISPAGSDCLQGTQATYYVQALSFHLSAMCREYNDFGSVVRDRAEGNVNSLDFEEFVEDTETHDDARQKENLMAIAEYERASMELAFRQLGTVVRDADVISKLKVFIDVTDTFGQMYVQKDFSSRKQQKPSA